ncbi:MAG: acyl-CoA reductase [Gemmatimonadota bacterium]|nr:acyl-CoA reductase [Gemmatimonadota bacterium]
MAERRLIGAEEARSRAASLREAGRALSERPISEVVAAVAEACARWADPSDPGRRAGVDALADHFGVPPSAVEPVLEAAFPRWSEPALLDWIEGELGDVGALDGFVPLGGTARRAIPPRILVVLAARGVPTTPVADLLSGLCVGAATWVKPASGADDLVRRFADTVAEIDPEVGEAVETAGWSREREEVGRAVLGEAETVVATGDRSTMERIRAAVPPETRLVLHGPRMSVAILTREAIDGQREAAIGALADDAAFSGQLGCLSPVVAYVEAPKHAVDELAAPVRAACEERWPAPARREADAAERAKWAEWTTLASVEAAAGAGGAVAGGADAAWTVRVGSGGGAPEPPPVPRALVLVPVDSAEEVAERCARRRGGIATVGVAGGTGERIEALAPALAAAGVERVCRLGEMQRPPLAWRRDGRPTLGDLVRWVDLEGRESPP